MIWDFLKSLLIRENVSDRSDIYHEIKRTIMYYGRVNAAFLIQKYDVNLKELATFIHRNEDVEMHDEKGSTMLTIRPMTPPCIDDVNP